MRKKFRKLQKWLEAVPLRTKMFAVAGVTAVVMIAVVIALISLQKPVDEESSLDVATAADTATRVQQTKRDGAIRDAATKALEQGDSSKAGDVYKSAIEAETKIDRKIKLTIDQSGVLYASGNYAAAIQAVLDVESLSEDKYLVADWLSRLYEDQKQYDKAAHYYTLAGQWADSPNNLARMTKAQYDQQAARMTQLAKG